VIVGSSRVAHVRGSSPFTPFAILTVMRRTFPFFLSLEDSVFFPLSSLFFLLHSAPSVPIASSPLVTETSPIL